VAVAVPLWLEYIGALPDYYGINNATKYVNPAPGNAMDTYVAAGIAIQSNWLGPQDTRLNSNPDSGLGIANVSDNQMNTDLGMPVSNNHGFGLGMAGQDQTNPTVAVEAMRRRIQLVTDICLENGCSSTDLFIAAALAQNSGFTKLNMRDLVNGVYGKRLDPSTNGGITIPWFAYTLSVKTICQ
jgi:hypothetical protein